MSGARPAIRSAAERAADRDAYAAALAARLGVEPDAVRTALAGPSADAGAAPTSAPGGGRADDGGYGHR